MVYQRRVVDGSNNYDYRVGIWMNCYDLETNLTSIRLYGGTTAKPSVMIGNLNQANLDAIGGITPSGWSLYADGAFLKGAIVSTEGQIGGFTIGEATLKNGDLGGSTSVVMSTGASSSTAIGGSSGTNTWAFTASNKYGVTTSGALYSTSGKIGGWTIDTNSLGTGTWGTENGVLLCTGASGSKSIGGSASISGWTITSGANFGVTKTGAVYANDVHLTGAITATSGTIGGASITNGVLQIANANITSLDASKINSGYIAAARINSGTITADKLAANTLHIGGHNLLKSSYLGISNSSTYNIAIIYLVARDKPVAGETVTLQIKGSLASTKTSWGIYNSGGSVQMTTMNSSNYDSTTGIYTKTFSWTVGSAANTYVSIYTLTNSQSGNSSIEWVMLERGNQPSGWGLSADEVGGFTVTNTSIYSGSHSAYNTAADGVFISSDYIALGSGAVTYFNKQGLGKIGPWTLGSTYFRNGNIASATNTTVAGVYLGTDGINVSNGTAATTAYITKSAVNIGDKLTWDGTTLSVSGNITATSGTIGGITANSSYGLYTNSKTSATSTNTGFLISKDGAIYLGAYNSTSKACPF